MAKLEFTDIVTRAQEMEAQQAQRNQMFNEIEDIYLLEPNELPEEDWVKQTISPDPRNELDGAMNLMIAADPVFTVPMETNNPQVKKLSSKIETFAAATWQAVGNLNGRPVQYDAVHSGLLYDELHVTVTLTSDLVKAAKTPAQKAQAEAAAATTPFIIEVVNPAMGYPEYGRLGLRSFLSKRELTVADVRDRYGEDQLEGKKASDTVNLFEYWDLTYHAVWSEGQSDPIMMAEHNLPFIPVVAVTCKGSRLFYRPNQMTRQPFLYTLWKTKLWDRQNLSLTLMYSLIFAIGSNPLYIFQRNNPQKDAPTVDYSRPGSMIILDQGERYEALAKQVLDPSILTGLQTAETKAEQSTIYRQVLGEPMGANAPFSMVSLLSQAGRQPLIPFQRMISFALGRAMYIGLMLSKQIDGGKVKAKGESGMVELDLKNLPDPFTLEAKLDISLPQDDRQNTAVAAQATGGPEPLVSKRYAREEILHIGQSDDMEREIYEEKYWAMRMQMMIQTEAQRLMAQAQQQQQPPAGPPGMEGPAGMPPGAQGQPPEQGGQMPPDLAGQMQNQLANTGAAPGLPGMPAGAPVQPGGIAGPGGGGQMPPDLASLMGGQ